MSAMQAALDDAGKVVKKQRTCAAKSAQAVDELLKLVEGARAAAAAGSATAVADLLARVEAAGVKQELNSQTKDLHSAVNRLSKVCVVSV
jgi:hypothetical protein